MNELKLEDFVGEKHEWLVASHKNKRLYATAFYYPMDQITMDIAFRIVLNGENLCFLSTLPEAVSFYNDL